jgi:hypothetical protein
MESKSMHADEKHTGEPDCPECVRIEAELSSQNDDVKERVDALMIQWDGMVERMSSNLRDFLKRKGRETLVRGANLLAEVQKKP